MLCHILSPSIGQPTSPTIMSMFPTLTALKADTNVLRLAFQYPDQQQVEAPHQRKHSQKKSHHFYIDLGNDG